MQPVLGLLKHQGMRRVDHLAGNFIAPVGRQTMQKDGVRLARANNSELT